MLTHEGQVIDLTGRAIFELTGNDTERFLNGQITQDIRLASETEAVYTCITNAKGKLQGDAFLRRVEGKVLLDCDATLKEDLFNRIDMYIIADDVEIKDVSEQYKLYHQIGTTAEAEGWKCNRYGVAGIDFFTTEPPNSIPELDIEALRIQNCIPIWGKELTNEILPPEAQLETRAISYTKGCYIGQEVISRMKSAGKVNKSLMQFTLSETVELPFDIVIPDSNKPAGVITSIAEAGGQYIALGYLTKKYNEQMHFTCDNIQVNVIHS